MRDRLKKGEFWSAMILLVLHVVVFPIGLSVFYTVNPDVLSSAQLNFLYYVLSMILVAIFLGKFLRRSFDGLIDSMSRCISSFLLGWLVYIVLSYAAEYVLEFINLDTGNNLNEETIDTLLGEDRGAIIAMTVFLAPIVEESLFRGGVFCGIYPKSRVFAYVASIVLFCLYHVWQYAIILWDPTYLLMSIQYVPAAFVLCWVYERSGSIWTGVFFHMSVNAVAVFATGSSALALLA